MKMPFSSVLPWQEQIKQENEDDILRKHIKKTNQPAHLSRKRIDLHREDLDGFEVFLQNTVKPAVVVILLDKVYLLCDLINVLALLWNNPLHFRRLF